MPASHTAVLSPLDDVWTVGDLERWSVLASAAMLVSYGLRRGSMTGACCVAAATPLVYRGLAGRWPAGIEAGFDTRATLAGARGTHVRESIRLELPLGEVYRFWRRLENLPRFMSHLVAVTDLGGGRSHWTARGPAGVTVEWDAEIINQIPNRVLAWRSLPGGDVTSAGSVTFEPARAERGTQLTVTLQYAPPAGPLGRAVATLFRREPSQTIREDLRTLKQILEAGEIARAAAPRIGAVR